jgi:hypothetical protein
MAKIPDLEGLVPIAGGATPARGRPAQVEADAADVLPRVEGSCVNEDMPRPGDASGGEAPTTGPPRDPIFRPLEDAMVSTPGSSDIVDFWPNELGLPQSAAPVC